MTERNTIMGMLIDYYLKQDAETAREEAALGLPRKRMYANERDSYLAMHMCRDILKRLSADMPARLKMAGAEDMIRDAADGLRQAMRRVYFTVPDQQRAMLENNSAHVTYAIGVKTPGSVGSRSGDSQWGMYISYADIETIVTALKDHCLVCMGTPQEQEACRLRAVFDRMGVDAEHVDGECGYRELI